MELPQMPDPRPINEPEACVLDLRIMFMITPPATGQGEYYVNFLNFDRITDAVAETIRKDPRFTDVSVIVQDFGGSNDFISEARQ